MLKAILGLFSLFLAFNCFADDLSAKQQAKYLIQQHIETSIDHRFNEYRNLNIRYRFPSSAKRLSICPEDPVSTSENTSVLGTQSWWIECPSEWRMKVSVTTKLEVKAVVTERVLKKNHRLQAEELKLDWRDLRYDHQVYQEIDSLVGLRLRRSLKANTLLNDNYVQLNYVIERGQPVIISYQSKNFSIETDGVAVEPGQIGDIIEVENARSGTLLHVTVLDVGRVKRH
ncbi:flagellar basal body P-ring formation chaperone FlgA [Vibrio algivorus]|nr:flagellar basal body P-ring formation chaperone FlgA [Vibrio algivorus]